MSEVKLNDAGESLGSVEDTLSQRGKRYGSFKNHANLAQSLKTSFENHVRSYGQPENFNNTINEAIDMIFHKIARIANGDPQYDDSWQDIAGYAQLVVDDIQGKVR